MIRDALRRLLAPPPPPAAWLPGVGLDRLTAHCAVLGQTGSGKTILLRKLIELVLRTRRDGLWVPLPKPGDRRWMDPLLALRPDPVVLDADCRHTVNPFAAVTVPGLDAGSQAVIDRGLVTAAGAAVQRLDNARGEADGGVWRTQAEEVALMACQLARLAGRVPDFDTVWGLIDSAATSLRRVGGERHAAGLNQRLCLEAFARHRGTPGEADCLRVLAWWAASYPAVPPRQRQGVLAQIMPALSLLRTGLCGRTFAGAGTLDLRAAVEGGRVLVSDFPVGTYGALGVALNAVLKYTLMRVALGRVVTRRSPYFWLVVDEFPLIASDGDATYLATARSFKCPLVYGCQGRESLVELWPGGHGEARADAILANAALKVCTRQGLAGATWLSQALGSRLTFTLAGGTGPQGYATPAELLWGSSQAASASFSQQLLPWLTPADLVGLRTGSDGDGKVVDAIIVPSSSGRPYRRVSVRREG